jgi:putative endonuclease
MYYVYVIKSIKDGKNYTGLTDDIERRLKEHNSRKKSTPSTMNRGPFELIYSEECSSREEARKREKYLKSGIGREFIKQYIPR